MSEFAPEVAVEGTLGVGLIIAFMATAGLIILKAIYAGTLGGAFAVVADALDFKVPAHVWYFPVPLVGGTKPLGEVAKALRAVNAYVYKAIGEGVRATEHGWHTILLWMAYVWTASADELSAVTYDTLQALHLVHKRINTTEALAHGALVTANVPAKVIRVVAPQPVAAKQDIAAIKQLDARVAKLEHAHATTIAGAPPVAIPHIPSADEIWNDVRGRIERWGKYATVGGLAAIIGATIFKTFKLGWLRCPNVNKIGRALCGLPASLLEDLLAGVLDALIVTDLCQLAGAVTYAAEQMQPLLLGFVDLEHALVGCHGAAAAKDLPLPALSLPTATVGLAL